MNKYQLIENMVIELNCLTVQGVENMRIVIETIRNLDALSKGLQQETENYQKRIAELEKQLKEDADADDQAE